MDGGAMKEEAANATAFSAGLPGTEHALDLDLYSRNPTLHLVDIDSNLLYERTSLKLLLIQVQPKLTGNQVGERTGCNLYSNPPFLSPAFAPQMQI